MTTPKEQILQRLEELPDEVSVVQAIEEVYILKRLAEGMADTEANRTSARVEARRLYSD